MGSNMELTVAAGPSLHRVEGKLNHMSEEFQMTYAKWSDRFRNYHATYMQNCADFEHYQQKRVKMSETLSDVVATLKDLCTDLDELGTLQDEPQEGDVKTKTTFLDKYSQKKLKAKLKKKTGDSQPEDVRKSEKSRCVIS
ncbi:hypothetical protein KR067_006303 [Drosophila pandora]|nr:hypothetical protein KR067_006303 [Drosophila pandora]